MVQTIQAKDITLYQLESIFGLQFVDDDKFFREWQDNWSELTDLEKQRLDRVKANYFNLIKYPPLLENTVKMVVLSPLLDLADFYLSPFHVKSEKSVEISEEDEGVIIKGQIEVLVLREQLWLMVIESKKAAFSIEEGLAQILAYMLATPHPEKPSFGVITTGGSFIFIKVVKGETPQYATSRIFELRNPGNDLYSVLSVLKQLGRLSS
ncbi:MAG: restriction endonuclease subunit R [Coleofasciculus sp. C3-bin4]|nr:restriction endonuclease subunit R [Coleofasciculus sp. C3-bin4]